MGTITKTFTENNQSSYKSTWTLTVTASDVTVTGDTINWPKPTLTAKYVNANKNRGAVVVTGNLAYSSTRLAEGEFIKGSLTSHVAMTSGTTYTITSNWNNTANNQTSLLFNSSNPTTKKVNIPFNMMLVALRSSYTANQDRSNGYSSLIGEAWGTLFSVTLDAPPTFTVTMAMHGVHAKEAIFQVTYTNCFAQYGGNITQTKLTIGSQTATGSGNGTLTINLDTAGTFTPQVSVTDSRGQVTTKSLSSITVLPNICDIQSLDVQRIDSTTGKASEEGENAVIAATIDYTEFTGNCLEKPTVEINGTTATNSVTWYEGWTPSGGFSNPINWSNYAPTAPATIYGKAISQLAQTDSHNISVTASSRYVTSKTISRTLPQAFYLLAGRAGGHGLGIGMKPPSDGLHVGMDADFYDDVNVSHGEANREARVLVSRTDTDRKIWLGIGAGGNNAGVYDRDNSDWMIYNDAGGDTHVPSNLSVDGDITNSGSGRFVLPNNYGFVAKDTNNNRVAIMYLGTSDRVTLGGTNYPLVLRGTNASLSYTGALSIGGDITVAGHSSNIGTYKDGSTTKNLAHATGMGRTGVSFALEEGAWVVSASIRYPTNATGNRRICLYGNSLITSSRASAPAISGQSTDVQMSCIVMPASASVTYEIGYMQNSGSTLSSCDINWRAVRIA